MREEQMLVIETKIEKLERSNANRLSKIQKVCERYDAWNPLPKNCTEIQIFDPDTFVKKQIGNEVSEDIMNDVERLKTKLYHPDQYDEDRAKEAFDAVIKDEYEKKITELNETTNQFNDLVKAEKNKKRKSKQLNEFANTITRTYK